MLKYSNNDMEYEINGFWEFISIGMLFLDEGSVFSPIELSIQIETLNPKVLSEKGFNYLEGDLFEEVETKKMEESFPLANAKRLQLKPFNFNMKGDTLLKGIKAFSVIFQITIGSVGAFFIYRSVNIASLPIAPPQVAVMMDHRPQLRTVRRHYLIDRESRQLDNKPEIKPTMINKTKTLNQKWLFPSPSSANYELFASDDTGNDRILGFSGKYSFSTGPCLVASNGPNTTQTGTFEDEAAE